MLIVQKCETTLTWEQLRSPQVSQFLVKPIQSQIRNNHFNRATLSALIANCLQFKKEAEASPGNASVSKTRAMLSELLAMRLLKEYTTRELIDALSYDFDPLQGIAPAGTANYGQGNAGPSKAVQVPRGARISTVEIAIRATAKRFLSHPSVVQQLEAIWAGSIVFHTAADHLHRRPEKQVVRKQKGYGTIDDASPRTQPVDYLTSKKLPAQRTEELHLRRSVTLYNPRDASLFKLSRLRVPRYRQVFSTISYAVMLALFIAVLAERSLEITALEIVFWFWSAGYMLDEVVGFSEQGFGLYIMSVWNAFDLGILGLFSVYYILRVWCVVIADVHDQHRIAGMAYDVLASTAILLFPRAFSVLDHYKYFSQLLIAFRLMAQDLIAILVLITITCSGFFVCFTLSFSSETTTGLNVAFALFQIVLGFSPAAWNVWSDYNLLGQIIMGFFLTICHFLIVTILITVLTNSFMAIVQNANEEHQFLFAVNTISMVKSDALFSYIAPSNVLAWSISPVRYIMPFRQFVKLNRTLIKITHFPVLLIVFLYERLILANIAYEPTDLVERKAPVPTPGGFSLNKNLFSPGEGRLREASVVSFHKDRALDEVFRRPFQGSTVRTTAPDMAQDRRQSTDVVHVWMNNVGDEGGASPPIEQPQSELDRLETRRPPFRRALTADTSRSRPNRRDLSSASRSVMSDPEDRSFFAARRPKRIEEETDQDLSLESIPQDTEADGDDELVTGDEGDTVGKSSHALGITTDDGDKEDIPTSASESENPDYFATPIARKSYNGTTPDLLSHAARARLAASSNSLPESPGAVASPGRSHHARNVSNRTIVQPPPIDATASSASEYPTVLRKQPRPQTTRHSVPDARAQNVPSAKKTPRPVASRARPAMPIRSAQQTAPNMRTLANFSFDQRDPRREPPFNTMALDLASDFGDNRFGATVDVGGISGMPASFSEQLFRERELARRAEAERKRAESEEENSMVGRIMLARMNTLEEGFREMLKEVRVMRLEGTVGSRSGTDGGSAPTRSQRGSGVTLATAPNSGSGSSGLLPETRPVTPLSKSFGSKPRKSPRKIQRRPKGKEPQGFFSSGLSETVLSPELDSNEATPMEGVQREDFATPGTLSPLQQSNSNRASVIFVGDESVEGSREIAEEKAEKNESMGDGKDKTDE